MIPIRGPGLPQTFEYSSRDHFKISGRAKSSKEQFEIVGLPRIHLFVDRQKIYKTCHTWRWTWSLYLYLIVTGGNAKWGFSCTFEKFLTTWRTSATTSTGIILHAGGAMCSTGQVDHMVPQYAAFRVWRRSQEAAEIFSGSVQAIKKALRIGWGEELNYAIFFFDCMLVEEDFLSFLRDFSLIL